jgi:hypothetical protein
MYFVKAVAVYDKCQTRERLDLFSATLTFFAVMIYSSIVCKVHKLWFSELDFINTQTGAILICCKIHIHQLQDEINAD